ncbi:MAG: GWxTD domain-containing protein [Bacteroidota bacterium]
MKAALCLFLLAFVFQTNAQQIAGHNFRYWYDPDNTGQFDMKVVRAPDSIYAYFQVDTTIFSLDWNGATRTARKAATLPLERSPQTHQWPHCIPRSHKTVAAGRKTYDKRTQEVRLDFKLIEANYPADGLVWRSGKPVFDPYVPTNTEVTITNNFGPKLKVFHYTERFPAGSPPFAEKELPVDPIMQVDSSFWITSGQPMKFRREGLYLVQQDTNATRGVSFRVSSPSYPKMTKVEDLSTSLVFISTKEEADRLEAAGGDKSKFDFVVLDITRDKDRARQLIRLYFRRVELANIFFTSYKEGWKTDRGMIYLVFGLPDEINKNGQFEVWTYKTLDTKFTFYKTGSVYDPDYFVLERHKKFAEAWYYTIDNWRKSQITSAVRN